MIVLYLILLCFTIPFILAIIRGLIDGWNGTQKYKHLYCLDSEPEETEDCSIIDEIAHLEVLISRNMEAALIIEKELEYTFNDKKRVILLSKLNNLDNQTFKHKSKIIKLKEKLE